MSAATAADVLRTVPRDDLEELARVAFDSRSLMIVTGAGISTRSGIPDYRSPGRGEYKPLQQAEFVSSRPARQRYWARSTLGYRRMNKANPNLGHDLVAGLERWRSAEGLETALVTQNVDGLHARAGSPSVLELHGTIHRVGCLECGVDVCRAELQQELERLNAGWLSAHGLAPKHGPELAGRTMQRPDGDAELPESAYASFRMPHLCLRPNASWSAPEDGPSGPIVRAAVKARREWEERHGPADSAPSFADALHPLRRHEPRGRRSCANALMPRVVFHGGALSKAVSAQSLSLAAQADGVLVLGSSLTVFSAYRLVRQASLAGARVAIVNHGATRADALASAVIDADIPATLECVAAMRGQELVLPEQVVRVPSPLDRAGATRE
ncbi:hypothetical protein FNF31_06200 [Cafeteria roenbergensis]|uniref:Deacetylase sirtuin-type domain-containing protein n=1 Tax=Cafeteria roenbergensis TaxID=33653 RepID=A0A5A8D529_CAFRO|nr:hypothetical protein FNF31_06200 [Cafeteria roenbergensis]KAA0160476.1 hypothetical protein FNF28_05432 [Cafeteria roenbergensis]